MAFFKPWTWFKSEERELKIQLLEERLRAKDLELQIAKMETPYRGGFSADMEFKTSPIKPYSSLRLVDDTAIVVLKNGKLLTKENVGSEFFNGVKRCVTEAQVISLFYTREKDNAVETDEDVAVISNYTHVLLNHPEFELNGFDIRLKGVNLPMPASVSGSFMELVEKMAIEPDNNKHKEDYEALKMFWYWTALNPIESSRNDLLAFVRKHDINITKNGLMEMYRKVVSVDKEANKSFIDAVSRNYFQVKKWKKNPSHYFLWNVDEEYSLFKEGKTPIVNQAGITVECVGNLAELYKSLPEKSENRYTDNHTMTKDIRVGQVYKEDEDLVDLNNLKDCSSGLHVGNKHFSYSGFGDTGVLALVNPSKVRSVPVSDTNKMRVSEMYIAAILPKDVYDASIDESIVADFSEEYCNNTLEELHKMLEDAQFDTYSVQGNDLPITKVDIESIVNTLSNRVVELN